MKTCTKCKKEKDELKGEFPNSRYSDGFRGACKTCTYDQVNQWVHGPGRKKILLLSARKRAKRAGVPFAITEDDFEIPERCPVFGFPLVVNRGGQGRDSISLDRINPALGYVPGNVQVISLLANQMKNEASIVELQMFANWIRREYV